MRVETAEWVEKAEGDWHTSERELRATEFPNYHAVCFQEPMVAFFKPSPCHGAQTDPAAILFGKCLRSETRRIGSKRALRELGSSGGKTRTDYSQYQDWR